MVLETEKRVLVDVLGAATKRNPWIIGMIPFIGSVYLLLTPLPFSYPSPEYWEFGC